MCVDFVEFQEVNDLLEEMVQEKYQSKGLLENYENLWTSPRK